MSQTQQMALDMIKAKFKDTFLLNKTQTAEMIGNISRATLDRLTKAGKIPATRIGGQIFYKIDDVAIFIAGSEA